MFYHYSQNNSGGFFTKPAINVIIEAASSEQADVRAQDHGLYFGGEGDCPCCGDRWNTIYYNEKGDVEPSIYGEPVESHTTSQWAEKDIPEYVIYYVDGRVESSEVKP